MELSDGTSNYGFPSSYHPGGVHVAFVGGQVEFVTDQIDNLVYAQLMTSDHKKSDLEDVNGNLDRELPQPQDDAY
jgi:prepilin-type processing-associated H-X9-DG protein